MFWTFHGTAKAVPFQNREFFRSMFSTYPSES